MLFLRFREILDFLLFGEVIGNQGGVSLREVLFLLFEFFAVLPELEDFLPVFPGECVLGEIVV